MCRNIKTLYNFDPPATNEEIQAASLQFVRKLTGFTQPSGANETEFNQAAGQISLIASKLLSSLVTATDPRNREVEAEKAHKRALKRFGKV